MYYFSPDPPLLTDSASGYGCAKSRTQLTGSNEKQSVRSSCFSFHILRHFHFLEFLEFARRIFRGMLDGKLSCDS